MGKNTLVYGQEIQEESMKIAEYQRKGGIGVVEGRIAQCECYEVEDDKNACRYSFLLTDSTGIVGVEVIRRANQSCHRDLLQIWLCVGGYVKVKGYLKKSDFFIGTISDVTGIEGMEIEDHAEEKRVELYCHPRTSTICNRIVGIEDIITQAVQMGHRGLAITDYMTVEEYPNAERTYLKIKKKYESQGKKLDFKLIYGVEAYLVDDMADIITNPELKRVENSYVAFEVQPIETTQRRGKIIRISAVKVRNGNMVESFDELINPHVDVSDVTLRKTGIEKRDLYKAADRDEVLRRFIEFAGDNVLIGHDIDLVKYCDLFSGRTIVDTQRLTYALVEKTLMNYKVRNVANYLKVPVKGYYKTREYVKAIAGIYEIYIRQLKEMGIETLSQTDSYCKETTAYRKHLPMYHGTILIANMNGCKNLYSLIRDSWGKYYYKIPRMSMRDLHNMREGLLIGSGSVKGELFTAFKEEWSDTEIRRLAEFYDYYEIQPHFLYVFSEDWINNHKDINREIVRLGETYQKPVVATGNVYRMKLDKDSEIEYLKSLLDNNAPSAHYLRTTDDMLGEFCHLDEAKAKEVVVTNTNIIADWIEPISPFGLMPSPSI